MSSRANFFVLFLQRKPWLRPFWLLMKSLLARSPPIWNAPKLSAETWLNMQTWCNKDSSIPIFIPAFSLSFSLPYHHHFQNVILLTWHAISRDNKKIGKTTFHDLPFSCYETYRDQRHFLVVASRSKKPSDADLMKLLAPTSEAIQGIQSFREKNRTSPLFNHLSAISESIPALGWVTVAPAPGPYIKEMNDAGQFYTNRVLKDWKDKYVIIRVVPLFLPALS